MSVANESSGDMRDWLSRLYAVTDAALNQLGADRLLNELLGRVQAMLRVDTVAVLLRDPDGVDLVATASIGIDEEVRQGVRVPLGRGFAGRIAQERRPVILNRVDETTVHNPLLWQKGIRTLLGVPMVAAGDLIGVLHVGTLSERDFRDEEVRLLQLVADRIALATKAQSSETERAAAAALQRSLLPSRLPRLPGLELAARYVPSAASGVGGDWYDAFRLDDKRLGVVVGDVVGHGLPAAVIMGRLRSALRAYSLETDDPGDVLDRLDRKVRHFEPNAMATVTYAIVEPERQRIRLALAGHPPPVLAAPGRPAIVLPIAADPLIGFDNGPDARRTHVIDLPPGSVVCFYTDGLVERRGTPIDLRLARLCEAVDTRSAEAVCATVMTALLSEHIASDDVTVLALRHTRADTDDAGTARTG